MHTLPQLRKLEERFPNELVVIGVHSPKFPFEAQTPNVRHAVLRHGVDHPVINDRDHRVWQSYTVRAWPTIYLVDPRGKIMGRHEGEVPLEPFARIIGDAIAEFDAKGMLRRGPLTFAPERLREPERPLAFPGKVLADAPTNRLIISDSGHHRIVVSDLAGNVKATVGSGQPGLQDGPFPVARFTYPQGLTLDGEVLYVADTENHCVRRVDLGRGLVETVAGTGEQARAYSQGGPARETDLSSPWDLALFDDMLLFANAGTHQIWGLDLKTGLTRPVVGAGPEGLQDEILADAFLAQPSGLSRGEDQVLWFADSETSSIRSARITPDGDVRTLIGAGLFDFGDADGPPWDARLQHPLGVAWGGNVIYIADTYNNKVKVAYLGESEVRTLIGSGQPGRRDGAGVEARLYEPGGISLSGDRLYIADTNNHIIRVSGLEGRDVRTLDLKGL